MNMLLNTDILDYHDLLISTNWVDREKYIHSLMRSPYTDPEVLSGRYFFQTVTLLLPSTLRHFIH